MRSLIMFCIFSGDIYLSLDTPLSISIFSASFITVSKLFCRDVFEIEAVLSAYVADLFFLYFYQYFCSYLLAKDESPQHFTNIHSLNSASLFIFYTLTNN